MEFGSLHIQDVALNPVIAPGPARQLSCHHVQLINQLSIIIWLSFSNPFTMLRFLKTKDLCFIDPCSSPEVPLRSARVLIIHSLKILRDWPTFHFYTLAMEMRPHRPFKRSKRSYEDGIITLSDFQRNLLIIPFCLFDSSKCW